MKRRRGCAGVSFSKVGQLKVMPMGGGALAVVASTKMAAMVATEVVVMTMMPVSAPAMTAETRIV